MKLPSFYSKKLIFLIIFIVIIFSIIATTVIINTRTDTDSRSDASTEQTSHARKLKVRVQPEIVRQGEGYTLHIEEPQNYSGVLDVKLNRCEYLNSGDCNITEGKWFNAVEGKVQVAGELLKDVNLGTYEAVFRPIGSDWEWSNPITVTMPPYDMTNFWMNKPGNYWIYETTNYLEDGKKALAKVEIEAPEEVCGTLTTPWRYTKEHRAAYWGPGGDYVMRWFVVPFEKRGNWKHEYLWAKGYKTYHSNGFADLNAFNKPAAPDPGPRGNIAASNILFTSKVSDQYPVYLLSPRQLDTRWEKTNTWEDEDLYVHTNEEDFCKEHTIPNVPHDRVWPHAWHVDYSVLDVDTPAYSGSAIRIRFMEGALREDYYLAENTGVVQIDITQIKEEAGKGKPVHWGNCDASIDPNCQSERINESDLTSRTVLQKAYLGEKLKATAVSEVKAGQAYTTKLSYMSTVTGEETPYSGYTTVQVEPLKEQGKPTDSIEYFLKDQYVDNGLLDLPATKVKGRYRISYKRWIPNIKQLPHEAYLAQSGLRGDYTDDGQTRNTITLQQPEKGYGDPFIIEVK